MLNLIAYRLVIKTADAKYMYRKKRDFYDSHSARCKEQYPEAFEEWQKVDRYHTFKDGKEIVSPYCFRSKQYESATFVMNHVWHTNYEKVPSLKSVMNQNGHHCHRNRRTAEEKGGVVLEER